jgi:hypothetical protein
LARPLIAPVTAPAGGGAVGLRARARVVARAADPGRRTSRASVRWGLLLAAGWLAQAVLRAWFGRMQVMPLANPDETAYLIAGRVLAGGPTANLSGSTLYPAGYPLLIMPVYWFTSDPSAVYHAVVLINSAISAAVMPLGYLACRRLGLHRPAAYGVAMVAALLPAGLFYSQYAMADAIFPVITLGWLLAVHSWLSLSGAAASPRARNAAAVGSAALAGYAYAVHSRGLVMLLGYAVVGAFLAWRRPAARLSVVAAALTVVVAIAVAWGLNFHLAQVIYPEGTRSLSGQTGTRLTSFYGVIHVLEMAVGQLWRLTLNSWGIAGIGLIAAAATIVRRGVRAEARIMAALCVAVTVLIACTSAAALPPDQSQTWVSGRYLDGMTIAFFLAGAVVLLRESGPRILAHAACVTGLFVLASVIVAVYAGMSLPTSGFSGAFGFAEPAVLTHDWTQASVLVATAVTLGLLLAWVAFAFVLRRWRPAALVLGACVAAVSLVAAAQMTASVSQAWIAQAKATSAGALGLKPGEQIAIGYGLSWPIWVPQAFEVSWTRLQFFHTSGQPPANASLVEVAWPAGQPAQASWPGAPAGWRVVASDRTDGWVAWRPG